ncbi:hypothetical protein BOMU111920_25530 [Bordetella muralis]
MWYTTYFGARHAPNSGASPFVFFTVNDKYVVHHLH